MWRGCAGTCRIGVQSERHATTLLVWELSTSPWPRDIGGTVTSNTGRAQIVNAGRYRQVLPKKIAVASPRKVHLSFFNEYHIEAKALNSTTICKHANLQTCQALSEQCPGIDYT